MAKGEKTDSRSRMVQVAPNEMIARRGNESNAEVRARYARERELEARASQARNEVARYDNRRRRSPVEDALVGLALRDPAARRARRANEELRAARGYKAGGKVEKAGSASKRADGCAIKGKTKGRFV